MLDQTFTFLPLEHSENLDNQKQCLELFEEFAERYRDVSPGHLKMTEESLKYAKQHYEVIEKYGRYPYRNGVLGRESTPEELEYLKTANTYGQ